MSFINIINESFDKQNKNILAGSASKKLKEAAFTDNFNSHSDELDRFYDYMFEAAKDLGFQDFDAFDDGWTVTLTYIDSVGNKQQAEFDFDDELSFESKEDAIDCLVSLDWKVVDDEDTKSLREYFDYGEAKDFDELGDMLDQSGDLIREAAEKLGFKDFEWEDSVQGPYGRSDFWITGDDGTRLHAMVDFSETWVTDLDEAIMLLDNLEWEDTSDGGDNDEVNDDLNKLKSLSYIPESFFSNSKIKSIDIPGNIKSIEREAFSNCKKLEDITFSVGLKDIGEQAFYSCTHVEFIDFPESLITISDGAFMDCKSLISVTIPTSVKSIGDDAFSFCPRLYEIRYNGTHQDWQKIKLGKRWAFHSLINIIECTDGTLQRSGPDPTICDWVFNEKRDLDENTQAKKLECKSRGLTEAQGDFNPATLKKYGVVRDPANDFVDDGNRFTAYLYKGVIPISYLKSKGQVYLSIAFHDLDDVNYDEYKNFESYQDSDKYNGVPADSVDIEDFVSILERAKKDYEEFKASVKAPNIDDYKAFRKVYADYFKKVSERAKKLIADNIDTIADLSDYELKKIFEYYKSIKSQLSRWINDDAISQMSPSAIRHDLSPESIERQKKQIANIDDYFYLRYIRDYIEGDKAK